LQASTVVNPDLVGEVRMILAPVDAELGRGSGQFQIQTRSGTNAFHGAGVWNVQNSFLDARSWSDNQTGATPLWRNQPELTASLGGPIKRNKTFFYFLYDQQWARIRETVTALSLTPCARRGIFRYFDNVSSANGVEFGVPTWAQPTVAGALPTTPAVNQAGAPRTDLGPMRFASVFGQLVSNPTQPDCSDAVVTGAPRDPYRTRKDPTGYVDTLFKLMPPVNNYDIGDGLNTAGHRWTHGRDGGENLFGMANPIFGNSGTLSSTMCSARNTRSTARTVMRGIGLPTLG
jgi:hypothetical protein